MALEDRAKQREQVEAAMATLLAAHDDVGGDIVSAGGTGTYDIHATTGVTEVQAGSYALMDTAYAKLGLPFRQAVFVVGTVIAVRPDHAVADVGLKALGMDHGNPSIDGARVWFCSDEHVTFAPGDERPTVGDRVRGRAGPRRPDDGDARGGVARRRRRGARPLADRPPRLGMTGEREGAAWLAVGRDGGHRGRPVGGAGAPPRRRRDAVADAVVGAVGGAHRGRRRADRSPPPRHRRRCGRRGRRGDGRADGRAAPPAARPTRRPRRCASPTATCCTSTAGWRPCPTCSPRSTPTSSRSASSRPRTCAALHGSDLAARYPHRVELAGAVRQRHRVVEPPPADRPPHRDRRPPHRRRRHRRPRRAGAGHRDPHPEPDRPPRRVGGRPRRAGDVPAAPDRR